MEPLKNLHGTQGYRGTQFLEKANLDMIKNDLHMFILRT